MINDSTVAQLLNTSQFQRSGGDFDRREIILASNSIGPPMKLLYWRRLEELGYLPQFRSHYTEHAVSAVNRFGAPQVEIFMVSHRWSRPSLDAALSHPDDKDSTKARALVEFAKWRREWVRQRHGFLPEIFYWIDYCCFDQDSPLVNMMMLPLWIACCERVLCIEAPDYHERAWCRLELLLSYAFNFADHQTVIDSRFRATPKRNSVAETHVLKRPLAGKMTDAADAIHIGALEALACKFQSASVDRVSGRRLPLAQFDTTTVRRYRL
jgi:hypothetical protein